MSAIYTLNEFHGVIVYSFAHPVFFHTGWVILHTLDGITKSVFLSFSANSYPSQNGRHMNKRWSQP